MIRNRRGYAVLALGLTILAAACGDPAPSTSRAGTRLLAEAGAAGRRADAVSLEVRSRGAGRSDETFARRGEDSLVEAEYDDGGRIEVRRVAGAVYVRTALRIDGAPATGPWLRIDPGADQPTWIALAGAGFSAPEPGTVADLLTAGVDRVTAVQPAGRGRTLSVVPDGVGTGARPTAISLRALAPEITGRVEDLYSRGERVSTRTYSRVRWGTRALAITAPDGAVAIDGAVDPQGGALPSSLRREPTGLPAGWTRRATLALIPAQGSGTCQEVATIYAAPAPAPLSAGYLAVFLEPTGCEPTRQPGSAAFTAGPYRGWIGTDPATGATIGALTVEGTAVRFRTSLAPAAVAGVLAAWRMTPAG